MDGFLESIPALGGAFNLARNIPALFRKKSAEGAALTASSSVAQTTTSVWLGNVAMLAEKMPKKARGDFLGVLNTNFQNDAIVWIITKETAQKLVFGLQIVIVVVGGVIIFLSVRRYLARRDLELLEKFKAQQAQGEEKPEPQKERNPL